MDLIEDIIEALTDYEKSGMVTLTHYSKEDGLTELDPESGLGGSRKNPSGLDATTRSARTLAMTKGYMPRIYFGVGVGEEGGYRKEKGLGPHMYIARIPSSKIYDLDVDPAGALKAAEEEVGKRDPQLYFVTVERKIRDAGYDYYTRNHPSLGQVAVGFVNTKVEQVQNEVV